MANYYIADLHIGHENVIRFDHRPFSSLSEMHDTIIRNWNQIVTGNDTVYILGDFIWKSEKDWIYWVSPLAGKKVLVLGNHDPKQFTPEIRRLFLDVRSYMDIADEGRRVILCHYPIPFHVSDYSENCYMLYGHVHNTREETLLRRFRKEIQDACTERGHACGNFINVGCMMPWMNYTPQTLTRIIENEAKWRQAHTADGGQENER